MISHICSTERLCLNKLNDYLENCEVVDNSIVEKYNKLKLIDKKSISENQDFHKLKIFLTNK